MSRFMNASLWIIMLCSLACLGKSRVKPDGFIEKTIILKDMYEDTAFAKINLFIPATFDTLLQWVDYSDSPCSDKKKYRLTNSKECLIQESGFFHSIVCRDSLWRLTISHQCLDLEIENLENILKNAQARLDEYTHNEWRKCETIDIQGRKFAFMHWYGPDDEIGHPHERIVAFTYQNSALIEFQIDCLNHGCSDFARQANLILQSVVIEPYMGN